MPWHAFPSSPLPSLAAASPELRPHGVVAFFFPFRARPVERTAEAGLSAASLWRPPGLWAGLTGQKAGLLCLLPGF